MLPLKSETTKFCCFIFETKFRVALSKVEKCESVTVLHLLVINASFIEIMKGTIVRLKGSVMVYILSWILSKCRINLASFSQAAHSELVLFSIDIGEA